MDQVNDLNILFEKDAAIVRVNDKKIGTISYSVNPFHSRDYYLTFNLQQYDVKMAKDIINILRQKLNKPFQVMACSNEQELISFICSAGFLCKRKCYEVEAFSGQYVGKRINYPLSVALDGSLIYEKCCQIMLERYISTHEAISPWTGLPEAFFEVLPRTVFYELDGQRIKNLAFVEENEIAYVSGVDEKEFTSFAQGLVSRVLEQFDSVVFEADDCDRYAMKLKNLFDSQAENSFNTYILEFRDMSN